MVLIPLMLQAQWYPTPTGLPKAGRTMASELPLSVYVLIQFPDRHSPVEYPCYPECLQLCSTKQTTHRYPVLNLKEKHLLSANRLKREEAQQQEGVPQTRSCSRCIPGDSRHRVSVVPHARGEASMLDTKRHHYHTILPYTVQPLVQATSVRFKSRLPSSQDMRHPPYFCEKGENINVAEKHLENCQSG